MFPSHGTTTSRYRSRQECRSYENRIGLVGRSYLLAGAGAGGVAGLAWSVWYFLRRGFNSGFVAA